MPRFVVFVEQRVITPMIVQAQTEDDARDQALLGKGQTTNSEVFSTNPQTWEVKEVTLETEVLGLWV